MSPEMELAATVDAAPSRFQFRTADGVHSPDEFRPGALALLETLWDRPLGSLLVCQANYGLVGTVLAHASDAVEMTVSSARCARLCRHNARRNDARADVSLAATPAALSRQFDTCCYAPADYTPLAVGTQRLVDALDRLRPGGQCYLAARPAGGLRRYEECLATHCQDVETVATHGDVRVLAGTAPAAFEPPQHVTADQTTVTVDGTELSLVSAPGLFSPGRLDDGTRALLEAATVEDGERVLDLCCGCGPVGADAAAAGADVVLTDDSVRATECARQTLAASGLDGTVVTADCTRGVDGPFDRVLCNPPAHAGRGVLTELFDGVYDVLAPGRRATLVHHSGLDLSSLLRRVGPVVDRVRAASHTVVTVEQDGSQAGSDSGSSSTTRFS